MSWSELSFKFLAFAVVATLALPSCGSKSGENPPNQQVAEKDPNESNGGSSGGGKLSDEDLKTLEEAKKIIQLSKEGKLPTESDSNDDQNNRNNLGTNLPESSQPKARPFDTNSDFMDYGMSNKHSPSELTTVKPGFNIVPASWDRALGWAASYYSVKWVSQLLKNNEAEAYLNKLGNSIAKHSLGKKYQYEFHIVNSGEVNAFALPGGYVYVNRGLLENVKDEAELAGILAHEISHVSLRHSTNIISKQIAITTLAMIVVVVLEGKTKSNSSSSDSTGASLAIARMTNALVSLKFSRDNERQADIASTQIIYSMGYDPLALTTFFNSFGRSGWQPWMNWLATHPRSEDRDGFVQTEVWKMGGRYGTKRVDSPEFRRMQKGLSQGESKPL